MRRSTGLLLSLLSILFFNSCGIITKARYGNGLKLNFETSYSQNTDLNKTSKAKPKKNKSSKISNVDFNTDLTNKEELAKNEFHSTSIQPELDSVVKDNFYFSKNKPIQSKTNKKLVNISSTQIKNNNSEIKNEKPFLKKLYLALFFAFLFPIAGLILAIQCKTIIRQSNYAYRGNGLATFLIVYSIVSIILNLILIGLIIWWIYIF
jgi:uncharacterized membrane protein